MKIVTHYVLPDEPCYGLYEGGVLMPQPDGSTDYRWVQDVIVIRDDNRAHFITDLGPEANFKYVTPIMIPSLGDDTVAQLQDFAAKNRQDFYWQKRAEEMLEGSTLIRDLINQEEETRQIIRNRSTLGPHFTKQRNGYAQEAMRRRLQAKRENYYKRKLIAT